MAKKTDNSTEEYMESDVNVSNRKLQDDADERLELTIEKKLLALYTLQQIESQIDKIKIIRGELPNEVQDLEDEIAGLETRVDKLIDEISELETNILSYKTAMKDSAALIKKYDEQIKNVRNNREYESLSKEIEFQNLESQLAEKKMKEAIFAIEMKKNLIEESNGQLKERKVDYDIKNAELKDIIDETEKEELNLVKRSEDIQKRVEDRLLTAFKRIRKNARNGLAVVQIERDACGGCFNKIPPQHQLDIRMHKKIIVCEYCGRILVDKAIVEAVNL